MTFGLEFVLVGAMLTSGQAAEPPERTLLALAQSLQGRGRTTPIYEEIEVMRRLIMRRFAGPTPTSDYLSTAATFLGQVAVNEAAPLGHSTQHYYEPVAAPDGQTRYELRSYLSPNDTARQYSRYVSPGSPPAVEGVHLEGHGVVFTLTLPASADPRPTTKKPVPPAASEWDRIARELKGEKATPATDSPVAPPTVGDVLLRLLADNGKHFHHLSGDERLTVVVTFRGSGARPPTVRPTRTGAVPTVPAANVAVPPPQPPAAANPPTTARDYVLLGDLHSNQKQYDKAMAEYQRAIVLLEGQIKAMPDGGGEGSDGKGQLQQYSDLLSRIAQVQLGTGRQDEARQTLERARRLNADLTSTVPATAAAKASPAAKLPAKLIVSARKDLLEAVGSGKMDFDTFRQQVKIEYLTAEADKKD